MGYWYYGDLLHVSLVILLHGITGIAAQSAATSLFGVVVYSEIRGAQTLFQGSAMERGWQRKSPCILVKSAI